MSMLLFLFLFVFLIVLTLAVCFLPSYISFQKSDYGRMNGNSFFKTRLNTGNYGEFLTFKVLEKTPHKKKTLTNLYIPKKYGTLTEIDLLSITKAGVFVFESKNCSGWIFGNQNGKYWTQTFRTGRKNRFFNPILQNKAHINALKNKLSSDPAFVEKWNHQENALPLDDLLGKTGPIRSIIVFSKRCTLKKISVHDTEVTVVKRNQMKKTLKKMAGDALNPLNEGDIDLIYYYLKPYGRADEATKQQHIESVQATYKT